MDGPIAMIHTQGMCNLLYV